MAKESALKQIETNRRLLDTGAASFDLFSAAASLGRVGDRAVRLDFLNEEIDDIVSDVNARAFEHAPFQERVDALRKVLFDVEGFHGNENDYRAPENAYIDHVLDTRQGLPITLSIITVEVAKRAGLRAYGIDFPGHFVVGIEGPKTTSRDELILIDPFHKGRVLSLKDLSSILRKLFQTRVSLLPQHLDPGVPKNILLRLLNNMRTSAQNDHEYELLDDVLTRLLWLTPKNAEALTSRAFTRRLLQDDYGAHEDALMALSALDDEQRDEEIRKKLLGMVFAQNSIH